MQRSAQAFSPANIICLTKPLISLVRSSKGRKRRTELFCLGKLSQMKYVKLYIYIYIYIYVQRERERERRKASKQARKKKRKKKKEERIYKIMSVCLRGLGRSEKEGGCRE
jgi:hypothetical protein